jgi:hypothetical protein
VNQIHVSHITQHQKCAYQRYLRLTVGAIPPGVAIVIGSAGHKAHAVDLGYKMIHDGELPPEDTGLDVARDYINTQWKLGIFLTAEERKAEKKVRGGAIDRAVRMHKKRHATVAVATNPSALNWKWVIKLARFPLWMMAGEADVIEREGASAVIRDLKNIGRHPRRGEAQDSLQAKMYCTAWRVHNGVLPAMFMLDNIYDVENKTSFTTGYKSDSMVPDGEDVRILLAHVEAYIEAMSRGVFPPTNPDNWWCSKQWCGYYGTHCKYSRGYTLG